MDVCCTDSSEKGASDPSTTNLMALAKLFGVTAEEILKEVK